MYTLLSEEYDLQSDEIKRILGHPSFTPSHLSEMIENLEERKYLLNIIDNNNKKSNPKRYLLVEAPEMLWVKPECDEEKDQSFC